jgi:uncharacterized protein (TIGR03435 family)
MPDAQDMDLVREYARDHSEAAFTELVQRHINLVYSVAFRFTGNDTDAQDVTQAVFILLARKAASLRERTLVPGWLYETTRFVAARFNRTRARRQAREQEAYMQSQTNDGDTEYWEKLAPHLEAAMSQLAESDRALLLLRFYQNKTGVEAAALLGIREDAAHKRLTRAVEKLRRFFAQRGVTLPATAIVATVSAHSVQAAPVALAKTISTVAIAQGAAASVSTLALVKGGSKLMVWTKMQTAVVTAAVVLLAAGTTTLAVREIQDGPTYPWQVRNANSDALRKAPPSVMIVRAKHPHTMGAGMLSIEEGKTLGIAQPFEEIVGWAYGQSLARTVFPKVVPPGLFDFIANLPAENTESLQNEIKQKFGFIGRRETRYADVLLLQVQNAQAAGLQPADPRRLDRNSESSGRSGPGYYSCRNQPIDGLKWYLEDHFKIPVIDQTGLTNQFDIGLKWNEADYRHPTMESLTPALLDQLGLVLVPTNMPIEMLVVDKVKR